MNETQLLETDETGKVTGIKRLTKEREKEIRLLNASLPKHLSPQAYGMGLSIAELLDEIDALRECCNGWQMKAVTLGRWWDALKADHEKLKAENAKLIEENEKLEVFYDTLMKSGQFAKDA